MKFVTSLIILKEVVTALCIEGRKVKKVRVRLHIHIDAFKLDKI